MEVFRATRRGVGLANRLRFGTAVLLLFSGAPLASRPALAQSDSPTVVIQSVSLRSLPAGAEIEVEADRAPRWTIRYDRTGGFVLRMPDSVIGREIPDLESAEGPVAEVRLQQVADSVTPYTLLSVVARQRMRVAVRPSGNSLQINLASLESGRTPAPASQVEDDPPVTPEEAPTSPAEPEIEPPEADPTPTEPLPEPEDQPASRPAPGPPVIDDDLRMEQELEHLRTERDALALGNPAFTVAERAQPCLNLRSAPSGRELDCVDPGTRLIVLGLEREWARVRLDDRLDAWALFEYLQPAPALPSAPGERALQDRLARLTSELGRVRDENLELREAAASAQESLESAWEAQQILSARLVEMETGGVDTTVEIERLSEAVGQLEAQRAELTAELEALRSETAEAERDARQALDAARAERDELARLLDESRDALALGETTFVVLPSAQPCLNLRPEPGARSRLDCLPPGTRVSLLELRGEWARARGPGDLDGWLAHDFVQPAPAMPAEVQALAAAREEIASLRDQIGRIESAAAERASSQKTTLAAERAARAEADAQSELLAERIAELEVEQNAIEARAADLATELEAEQAASAQRLSDATAEIESLRSRLGESGSTLTAVEMRASELEVEIAALRARLTESGAALTDAESRATELQDELETQRAAAEEQTTELEARLEVMQTESEQTLANTRSEIESLRTQLTESSAALTDAESRATELDTQRAAAEEQTTELEARLELMQTETEQTLANARSEIESLRTQLTESGAALTDAESRATELQGELETQRAAAEEQTTELEGQLEALQLRAAESDSARLQAETRAAELEARLAEAEQETADHAAQLEAERAGNEQQLAEARSEIESLRAEIADSGSSLIAAQNQAGELEREAAEARLQIADLEAALELERTAVSDSRAEIAALRDRTTRSDTAIATAQAHVAELEDQIDALGTENAELREASDRAELRLVELASAVEDWKAQAEEAESMASAAIARSVSSADLTVRLATAEAESSTLREELAEARRAKADAEARLAASREAMELGSSTYVVRADADPCLNLRAQPGDGAPLDCLDPATPMTLLEVSSEWARARLASGVEGWLARAFIEPSPADSVDVGALEARMAELEAIATSASALASEAEGRVQVLTSRLADERSQRTSLELELESLRIEAEAAASLRSDADAATARLEADLETARGEIARLTTRLEEAERATVTAERQTDAASEAAARITELNEQLAGTAAELELLRLDLDEARRLSADLGARLEQSEQALATAEAPSEPRPVTTATVETASAAAPPEPEVEPKPERGTDPEIGSIEARALALEWARAWSDQRIDDYLAFYSRRFEPTGDLERSDWEAQRRQRVAAPSFIQVDLTDIETAQGDGGELSVRFTQAYRSNSYSDRVQKTLVLVREDGGWKILRELSS